MQSCLNAPVSAGTGTDVGVHCGNCDMANRLVRGGAEGVMWRPRVNRRTVRLLLVCVAVNQRPAAPPANPAAFDPKSVERFARGMVEGGPIIEELAMKNNVNNPNYRFVCFRCHFCTISSM